MDPVAFEGLRPKLEAIAYRMTGSAADAEDLVQDAWLRWTAADRSEVEDPEAFVVRIVTRLALDRLRSAAHRRETYVGPYLPEPMVEPLDAAGGGMGVGGDPAELAVLADSLAFSFLVLLDELSPLERAVLLLHDVFGYPFERIAVAVDRTVPAVRQTASRARRRIAAVRDGWDEETGPSAVTSDAVPPETLASLVVAMAVGDVEATMSALAPDVIATSDGGALQRAARRPVIGRDKVARILLWLQKRSDDMGLSAVAVSVNGRWGLEVQQPDGSPFGVITGDVNADGLIDRVYLQLNPEKLRHLAR